MRGHGAHFDFDIYIAPIDELVVIHRTRAARAGPVHIDCKVAGRAARRCGAFRSRAVCFVFCRRGRRRRRYFHFVYPENHTYRNQSKQ